MANRAVVTWVALEVPSQNGDWMALPLGIASAEAFGTAVISTGPVTISPSSIASAESVGGARWVGEGDPPAEAVRQRLMGLGIRLGIS